MNPYEFDWRRLLRDYTIWLQQRPAFKDSLLAQLPADLLISDFDAFKRGEES